MTYRYTSVALILALAGTTASGATSQVTVSSSAQAVAPERVQEMLGGLGLDAGGATPLESGTGVILGRVVDGDRASGIGGAIVTLTLPGFTPLRAQANGDGQFAFHALPPGTYAISTTRPGYGDGAAGRTQPGGPSRGITLTETVRTSEVNVPMWRYATITGSVRDEHNEPLVGAQVRVLRRDYVAGRLRLTPGAGDTTDDRGQYRISALEAGDYIVALPMIHRPSLDSLLAGMRDGTAAAGGNVRIAARMEMTVSNMASTSAPVLLSGTDGTVPNAGTTPEGLPLTYQTEFHPGAASVSRATPITLAAGEERSGIDFRVAPVRAMVLAGTVTGPDGPTPDVRLQLLPADSEDLTTPIETATTTTNANGHFTFAMVPVGQYTLRALRQTRGGGETFVFAQGAAVASFTFRQATEVAAMAAPLPDAPTLWADTPVGVDTRDVLDLSVSLRTGLTVNGTVHFTGSAEQPTPEQRSAISIMLEPADGRTAGAVGSARGRVDASGTFTTMGVPAGKYVLRVSGAPQGWSLRTASYGGRDITSTAIELDSDSAMGVVLSFTDRQTEVNGAVRDTSGNADARASVIVFPVDQTLWVDTGAQPRRLRQVRVGQDGRYTISGLPAGDYHLIAVDESTPRAWQDPAFLGRLAADATSVRIADGETRTYALTTVKGGR
jgi:hypothetical protein